MSVSVNTQLLGINDAIRALNKIEPGLRKQFTADATVIARPAIEEAQRRYNDKGWGLTAVHGVSQNWTSKNRKLFPYKATKSRNGVKIRLNSDRKKVAVILIEQRDPATAILETAGRKTNNSLGRALGNVQKGTSRVLGPALFSRKRQVTEQMAAASLKVIHRVEKELR